MYILNAFSASMLDLTPAPTGDKIGDFIRAACPVIVTFKVITVEQARAMLMNGFVSAVGHADTALLFSNTLGVDVRPNRISVSFTEGEQALLGQYSGPRLPEGASVLPEGAKITWIRVEVDPDPQFDFD
jgi:hypothetical protein